MRDGSGSTGPNMPDGFRITASRPLLDDTAQLVFALRLRPVVGRKRRIGGPKPVFANRPAGSTDVIGVQRAAVHHPANAGLQRRFGHVANAIDVHPPHGTVGISGDGDLGCEMEHEFGPSKCVF